jgi:hypothetical protein
MAPLASTERRAPRCASAAPARQVLHPDDIEAGPAVTVMAAKIHHRRVRQGDRTGERIPAWIDGGDPDHHSLVVGECRRVGPPAPLAIDAVAMQARDRIKERGARRDEDSLGPAAVRGPWVCRSSWTPRMTAGAFETTRP